MRSTFKSILRFSKNRHKNLSFALAASFMRSAVGITQILAIMITMDAVIGNTEIKEAIMKIIGLMIVCIVGNFIASYIEQTNTLSVGFYMVADKRVHIGNVLKNLPLGFFNNQSSDKAVASLTTTLSGIETASIMVMIGIVSGLFHSFCLFLFMMIYDYKIGLLMGLGMVVYLLIVCYQMKVSRNNASALQQAQTYLAQATLTYIQGIKVTKTFSYKEGDTNLKTAIQCSCKENITLTNKSMPSQFMANEIIRIFESVILVASLYICFQEVLFPITKAVVLLIFSFMAYAALNQAGSMLSMIGLLDSGIQEIERLENEKQCMAQKPLQNPENNEIVFKDVSFSYGNHEVLHNINTRIHENSLTAIIGPSGSGKTTLCQLIPRFRDVSRGQITIGKANVKNIDNKVLMSKISMVFQNVYLFEDSILNNIRFAKPNATMDEVINAAKRARCHDFIMAMPEGYSTRIKEGGNSLSGGEKQRISIARAILKDSEIIILDEATSALDVENESEILSAIDELLQNKTVIMIAHRMKTVEKANHIIVLEEGKIVQEGVHEELKNKEGLYRKFLQSRQKAADWKL